MLIIACLLLQMPDPRTVGHGLVGHCIELGSGETELDNILVVGEFLAS